MPEHWTHLEGVAPRELFLSQIDMDNTHEIADALVILANSEKFLKELHAAKFQNLLRCIKCPAFGRTTEKIDVIGMQIASLDLPPEQAQTEELENIAEAGGDDLD